MRPKHDWRHARTWASRVTATIDVINLATARHPGLQLEAVIVLP